MLSTQGEGALGGSLVHFFCWMANLACILASVSSDLFRVWLRLVTVDSV